MKLSTWERKAKDLPEEYPSRNQSTQLKKTPSDLCYKKNGPIAYSSMDIEYKNILYCDNSSLV